MNEFSRLLSSTEPGHRSIVIGVAFAGCWSLILLFAYWRDVTELEHKVVELATFQAKTAFEKDIQYRLWSAQHGGVYVPATEQTPPNPHLEDVVKERDITTPSGRQLTLVNPAYMTRQVHEIGNRRTRLLGHITSLKPLRPENRADPWERRALLRFEQGEREIAELSPVGGQEYLRYMKRLVTEEACLKCHEQQGYQVGDIRGGISISVPMAPVRAVVARDWMDYLLGYLGIWGVGIGLIAFGSNSLRQDARKLASVNRQLIAEAEARKESDERLEMAQKQLLQSEKLASIGQLAAGIAHEINNPVGFVTSNLHTLQDYLHHLLEMDDDYRRALAQPLDDAMRQQLERRRLELEIDYLRDDMGQLLRESDDGLVRVAKIVADLKSYARLGAHERAEVHLDACIETALNMVWNELKYKAEVIRDLANPPPILAVENQVNQVLVNLLVNAAQAIAERGTITVRSGRQGDWVFFSVIDTGAGMDERTRERLFDPFYTTKPEGVGTGLGLSVSYSIVQAHGGEIEVESVSGKGTCFTVRFPLGEGIGLSSDAGEPTT